MKKLLTISTIAIMVIIAFQSCKKNDNSSSSTSVLNTTVQQGKWKITLFNDSGNNETSHFTGYEFVFGSSGTVNATNGSISISGTWSGGNDDSTSKLVLSFSVNPFSELNEDWHVLEQNSSTIKLEHVSGGNGGTDYLTFEKI